MNIEAIKQALEALDIAQAMLADLKSYHQPKMLAAYKGLRQAIAEAEKKQKPVALPCCDYDNPEAVKWNPHNQVVQCHNCGQVYTPQRQHEPCPFVVSTKEGTHYCRLSHREPLTDEQISAIDWKQNETLHDFARAIEAAHGIKGEA